MLSDKTSHIAHFLILFLSLHIIKIGLRVTMVKTWSVVVYRAPEVRHLLQRHTHQWCFMTRTAHLFVDFT